MALRKEKTDQVFNLFILFSSMFSKMIIIDVAKIREKITSMIFSKKSFHLSEKVNFVTIFWNN